MRSVQRPTKCPVTHALRHHAPRCGPRPLTGALWPRPRCAPWEACAGEKPSRASVAPADQMRRLRQPLSRNSPCPAAPPTRVHKPFQTPALRMENAYRRLGSLPLPALQFPASMPKIKLGRGGNFVPPPHPPHLLKAPKLLESPLHRGLVWMQRHQLRPLSNQQRRR